MIERRHRGPVKCKRIPDYGPPYNLELRLDLARHSPTGFEVGYHGSGPAQLALAMTADAFGDEFAQRIYQDFKHHVIARINLDPGQKRKMSLNQTYWEARNHENSAVAG